MDVAPAYSPPRRSPPQRRPGGGERGVTLETRVLLAPQGGLHGSPALYLRSSAQRPRFTMRIEPSRASTSGTAPRNIRIKSFVKISFDVM